MLRTAIAAFLLSIATIGTAAAGPIEYTISGDVYNYNTCSGSYCVGGPYSLTATFDVASGTNVDNLAFPQGPLFTGTGGNIEPDVTSFSISDNNGFQITNLTAGNEWFDIATDGSGNITAWYILVGVNTSAGYESSSAFLETYYFPTYPQAYFFSAPEGQEGADRGSCFVFGASAPACGGVVTAAMSEPAVGAVPEPSAIALILGPFLAVWFIRRRRSIADS